MAKPDPKLVAKVIDRHLRRKSLAQQSDQAIAASLGITMAELHTFAAQNELAIDAHLKIIREQRWIARGIARACRDEDERAERRRSKPSYVH